MTIEILHICGHITTIEVDSVSDEFCDELARHKCPICALSSPDAETQTILFTPEDFSTLGEA